MDTLHFIEVTVRLKGDNEESNIRKLLNDIKNNNNVIINNNTIYKTSIIVNNGRTIGVGIIRFVSYYNMHKFKDVFKKHRDIILSINEYKSIDTNNLVWFTFKSDKNTFNNIRSDILKTSSKLKVKEYFSNILNDDNVVIVEVREDVSNDELLKWIEDVITNIRDREYNINEIGIYGNKVGTRLFRI